MATMNVSLPAEMKARVEQQTVGGKYANASDYVRDLIRRDIRQAEATARLQAEIGEGRAGPFSDPGSADELVGEVRRGAAARPKNPGAA